MDHDTPDTFPRTGRRLAITSLLAVAVLFGAVPILEGRGDTLPVDDTTSTSSLPALEPVDEVDDRVLVADVAPSTPVTTTTLHDGPTLPPPPAPYRVADEDVERDFKQLAADTAIALTTYDPTTDHEALVARLFPTDTAAPGEAAVLRYPDAWSRGSVVYPQLGGLRGGRASVMVLVDQEVGMPDGTTFRVSRTLDIRVIETDTGWALESFASAGGSPIEPPEVLSAEARAVLDHPGIAMSDSSRLDIYMGEISPNVLVLLAEIADRTPIGVVVLSTGHPFHVFGTDRQSHHTAGRAVDIYMVGSKTVAEDRGDGSATRQLVEWLYQHPTVRQVGSPWDIDGKPSRSFTDPVHQDHIHVAVNG